MRLMTFEEYTKFVNYQMQEWQKKNWDTVGNGLAVEIVENSGPFHSPVAGISFGVSWASISDKSIETAKKFQHQLCMAIMRTDWLNDYFSDVQIISDTAKEYNIYAYDKDNDYRKLMGTYHSYEDCKATLEKLDVQCKADKLRNTECGNEPFDYVYVEY